MIRIIKILSIVFALACATFGQTSSDAVPNAKETPDPKDSVVEVKAEPTTRPVTASNNPRYVSKSSAVEITKLTAPPVIDGVLNDLVWSGAPVFGDFLQIQPGDNVEPTHPSEVMIAYDAKNLYLAFRIKQDRNNVRATVARRDNIFNDDYVLLYLDTFNDQRQAYVIAFNPLGIQADGTFTEGRNEDYSVDIVMESKGVLTEDGFTIEAAIPFKSLRYEAGKNKQWGLHIFRRVKYKNGELNSWMPSNRSISGSLNQAGHITGLDGIETTRQLEINPSFTLSQTGRRTRFTFNNDPAGRFVNDGIKGEFGMTAKFGLTPTTTLDFAYNPDFAQVEADAPVSTANVRFPIFFAEKRPFFLERIDIFQSQMNVVNTRAIVDPDIAAKLTGRRGKNTFGVMYASDNAPGNFSDDERETLFNCEQTRTDPREPCPFERFMDKNADIGVLRVKRDIGRQHNVGIFATTYNFVDRHNHTAGVDGRFRLDKKTVLEFQTLGTHSRRNFFEPDLNNNLYRTGNGVGYRVWLERSSRNLYMNYLAQGRSRDYRADVGFTDRVDTNYLGSFIQYQTDRDAKKSIVYKRFMNATNVRYDWQGRSQFYVSETQGMIALQRQTFIGLGHQHGYERVFEHEFGARRTASRPDQGAFLGDDPERSAYTNSAYSFVETTPVKQVFAFLMVHHRWGQMDFDSGVGSGFPRVSPAFLAYQAACAASPGTCSSLPVPKRDPGPGNQLTIESQVRYQPTTAFQTQLNYNRRRLIRNDTGLVAFDENLFSSRSTYQFTRDIFTRLRLDYSNISRRIRPQLVFGWTPNPGTALYVGYSDDVSYNGWNPYTGIREDGLHGNGRSFFIKASYLFKRSF
jgi:hypothetical protein